MKNKIKLKKYLFASFFVVVCLLVITLIFNIYEYHKYTVNFNKKISSIVRIVKDKYPLLSDDEVMEILNSNIDNYSFDFSVYGIDINDSSIVINNDRLHYKFLIINSSFLLFVVGLLFIIFFRYIKSEEREINNITNYIEKINQGDYSLNIDSISEDELSILKNEIYKTTVKLREVANNSDIDKVNLKKSLEDISHQLKTPITSILIMLDNLIDDVNMDSSTREEFIIDIRREIININFLVQAILKLSKFDSNTVNFIKNDVNASSIVKEAVKNVSMLCDLKNISVDISGNDSVINCDLKWQIEAVTNILKNAIDHSVDGSQVQVEYRKYNIYTEIKITDFGEGISSKDLKHIFERFYKGSNATSDSIGIGLALAKSIIEADNGSVSVSSDKSGTCFTIKYFKI